MVSFKSHFWVMMLHLMGRKKAIRDAESIRATILKRREEISHHPHEGVFEHCDVREAEIGGFPVYYVTPKGGNEGAGGYVYYLHGGAYVFEIIPQHWSLVADMVVRTGRTFVVPIYPLAPEHDVNKALPFALYAYKTLEAQAGDARLDMLGDSAGAAMAVAVCQQLLTAGETIKAQSQILISPWMDVGLENPDARVIDRRDPWLAVDGLKEAGHMYANGLALDDPRVSPLYGKAEGLPATHILMGTRDILMPDAKLFADKLSQAGVPMSYRQYEGMFHCWPFLMCREAEQARQEIVELLA